MTIVNEDYYDKNHHTIISKGRRKFTQQEDDKLMYLISKMGTLNWNKISREMPGRNAKQCRDRYCNYLSVPSSSLPWSHEEDQQLLLLLNILGPKWHEISRYIPSRSGTNVKNRWYKHLRKIYMYQNKKLSLIKLDNEMDDDCKNISKIESINKNEKKICEIQKQYSISALLI